MTTLFEKEYGETYKRTGEISTYAYKYEVRLQKHKGHGGGDFEIIKIWDRLTLEQCVKYDWFFRRVAALEQIKNPKNKYFFVINRKSTEAEIKAFQIKTTKDKLTAAKAKVTEITNKIEKAKANWNQIFPIENEEFYQKAMAKLFTKKQLVIDMENEYKNLQQ